jgi:hypothetical protein
MGLKIILVLALALLAGCGGSSSPRSGQVEGASSSRVQASPSASVTPSASQETAPSAVSEAPSPPSPSRVFFSGLPAGSYITHLHSICNGSQAFHITVLQTLIVGGDGSGSIAVPASYFNRGLCVIVYANPSLSRVLTTQTI